MDRYFGTYQKFSAISEKEAGYLLNADNLVGDSYQIEISFDEGTRTAWLINKFGKKIGFFDEGFSRRMGLIKAKGWKMNAFLSYIAFTEEADKGYYWGEMAVICFDPKISEPVTQLSEWLSSRLREDVRPRIDFDTKAVEKLVATNGAWKPEQTLPILKPEKGTVIMKSSLSLGDKIIEEGRNGHIGCYAISWVFLIAVVAVILLIIKGVLL